MKTEMQMETYPAKKANKAKKALETIYPIEWEALALKEVIQGFQAAWGKNWKRFEELSKENESITLEEKNLPNIASFSKELIDLYKRIFHDLIWNEPYLCRMLAYITMNPEDREARQVFFERYLRGDIFETLDDTLTFENVLQGSDLAKSRNLFGIPVHTCFVGKVLKDLLDEAESRWMTDNGNPEHFKIVKAGKGLIFEYFKKADYESPLVDWQIDDILCAMFYKGRKDRRKDLFFGGSLDHWKFEVIKRFGNEEPITIPFHLLPKYRNLLKKLAEKAPREDRKEQKDKLVRMLWEIISARTPGKDELSLSASIKNQFTWRFGAEQKKGYIQRNGKRISKASIDHAGSLDDPIDKHDEEAGRRGDITEDDKTLDPETVLIESERYSRAQEYIGSMADKHRERLLRVLEQDGRRSMADQKFYNRKTKELREILDITT